MTALVEEAQIHNIDFNNTGAFKKFLDGATQLLGSFVYGTKDGLLTPDNAWYSRPGTTSVSALKYVNGYGVPGTGHVWRITGDVYNENASSRLGKFNPANPPTSDTDNSIREIKGGSWDSFPQSLPAAYRNDIHSNYDNYSLVGLVLVAAASARTPG